MKHACTVDLTRSVLVGEKLGWAVYMAKVGEVREPTPTQYNRVDIDELLHLHRQFCCPVKKPHSVSILLLLESSLTKLKK